MEDKEPKQRIYEDLGLEGAGVSYESFSKKFDSDPEARKSVYKDLGLEQAGVDYQTFETKMFGEKKNPIGNVSPTGGKVGASEIPSTGNEVADLLGYTKTPSPLIAETKTPEPIKEVKVEEVSIPKWGGAIVAKKGANKNYTEDIASVAYNAFKRGMAQGETATELNISEGGGDIDVNEVARLQKESQRYQPSEAYKKFNNSASVSDALKALAENPAKVLTELSLESLTAMMNHGIVGGSMWQPAVVGAGAGSVIPGFGTAAGAGSGFIAGTGLTSLNLEYSGKILETLAEEGIDTTNPDSLKTAFTDEKKFGELREAAWKKGVPVMVFDMISAGVAGKIGGKVASKLGGGLAGKVAAGTSEVAAQAALGGGGELAGEVAAGEKINPSAILAEMIGEPAGSVHEIAVGTLIENAKNGNVKKEDITAVVANPNVENTDAKDVIDISVGAGQIAPEVAEEIKGQIDDVEEINKTVPASIQSPQDRVAAIGLIEKRNQLQAESEQVDEAFKPAINEQIKAINEEIVGLVNNPAPRIPAFETDAIGAAQPIELSTEAVEVPKEESKTETPQAGGGGIGGM